MIASKDEEEPDELRLLEGHEEWLSARGPSVASKRVTWAWPKHCATTSISQGTVSEQRRGAAPSAYICPLLLLLLLLGRIRTVAVA